MCYSKIVVILVSFTLFIATVHLHLTNALRTFTASLSRSSSTSFSKLLIISFSSLVFLASWANSKKSFTSTCRALANFIMITNIAKESQIECQYLQCMLKRYSIRSKMCFNTLYDIIVLLCKNFFFV